MNSKCFTLSFFLILAWNPSFHIFSGWSRWNHTIFQDLSSFKHPSHHNSDSNFFPLIYINIKVFLISSSILFLRAFLSVLLLESLSILFFRNGLAPNRYPYNHVNFSLFVKSCSRSFSSYIALSFHQPSPYCVIHLTNFNTLENKGKT